MKDPNDPMYVACDGVSVCGLTTRELFAAMAMQGFCANASMTDNTPGEIARYSTGQADALIAELNKSKEPT
jgi:hypothetical protein